MLFTLIFVSLFVIGWSLCGLLPWLVASILTRGNAGMGLLPLCLFAANIGAMTVPLVGADGKGGLIASLFVAMGVSAALILVRRFAMGPLHADTPAAIAPETPGREN